MERRRVVITGLGAVTPIGLTAAESWQAVKDGVCGIAPITQFDPTDLKVHLAAEVKGFVPENYMSKPEAKRMGRFTQMAVVSAKEALDGAGFTLDEAEADRCGVIVSSGIGGLSITEAEHDKGKEKGWDRVSPFYIPTGICNMAAGAVEAMFCAMALHDGYLPATINYQVPDPACDLDVVPGHGRSADVRYAMSNSLGFGGHNGSLLFKRWEA